MKWAARPLVLDRLGPRYNDSVYSFIAMNPIEVLLLYTPLVQFLILYGLLYRHELSRLAHPLQEKMDLRAWIEVFERLDLAKKNEKVQFGPRVREYLLEMVLPTALLAALGPELFLPLVLALVRVPAGALSPLLFLLQFIPALYFMIFLYRNYLGPRPIHRHRSTLPFPRMSSMVRCLGRKETQGR